MSLTATLRLPAGDEEDLPLLRRWLAEPHVAEWWGDAGERRSPRSARHIDSDIGRAADRRARRQADRLSPELRSASGGRPSLSDQPFGTLGHRPVDRPAGAGRHRPWLGACCGSSSTNCSRKARRASSSIPHPGQCRAIRAYEKAGFTAVGDADFDLWSGVADGARRGPDADDGACSDRPQCAVLANRDSHMERHVIRLCHGGPTACGFDWKTGLGSPCCSAVQAPC